MTWWSRFILLSRTYGFTPAQVRQLTIQQASEYLSGIQVEKGDPAVRYEPIDHKSPDEVKFAERLKRARLEAKRRVEQKKASD